MKPTPRLPPDTDIRAYILELTPEKRRRAMALLGEEHIVALDRSWPLWRHLGQGEPPGDWRTWVIKAGRGFGKTRAGAEWISHQIKPELKHRHQQGPKQGNALKIALVAATLDEARKVMVEGESGLLTVADLWIDDWWPSRGLLKFSDGSEARLFSGASPEALRGPAHHIAWCDELAKWEKAGETWDMLQFGMRLGAAPRVLITTTPKSGPVLTRIMAGTGCVVTNGSSRANPHLPAAFIDAVMDQYAGTRLGRQEIEGELLPDAEGALWNVELLERCRLLTGRGRGKKTRPIFTRTVIGVDPPSGNGTCGIIACGLDADGIAYVLADHSVTARSPQGWAEAVAAAAHTHGTSQIIAETNQGGKMVEAVLRSADAKLRVKSVTAHLSKSDRAVPVASRFEAGKVKLCGRFPALEAELCGLIAGGGYDPVWSGGPGGPGKSPDRADACVWALTELLLGRERAVPRVRVM